VGSYRRSNQIVGVTYLTSHLLREIPSQRLCLARLCLRVLRPLSFLRPTESPGRETGAFFRLDFHRHRCLPAVASLSSANVIFCSPVRLVTGSSCVCEVGFYTVVNSEETTDATPIAIEGHSDGDALISPDCGIRKRLSVGGSGSYRSGVRGECQRSRRCPRGCETNV
jgi:hypothetical protein